MKDLKTSRTIKALPHPKDRKIDQLQRKVRRDVRLQGNREWLDSERGLLATRCFWFREQCRQLLTLDANRSFTPHDVECLTMLYIARNDEEIADLKKQRNPSKGRIKHLEALKQHENDQLASVKGIPVPDIFTPETVDILVNIWDADSRTLGCVAMSTCSKLAGNRTVVSAAQTESMQQLLKPTADVREVQMEHSSSKSKLARFTQEGASKRGSNQKKSVKTQKTSKQVAKEGKDRRVLQQQTQAKSRRAAAVAMSRGLV